jgi:hypothetical protein
MATNVETIKIIYWVLVSISLLFILGPIVYLYRSPQIQGGINNSVVASFVLCGLIFYTVAIILDKTIVKEGYTQMSRYNHNLGDGIYRQGGAEIRKEDIGTFDQKREFNGIGDISGEVNVTGRNRPTENKIPNLKLQKATDLVDYTTIRNSLGNSFQGGPFSFGAETVTRVKSNPNGF